MNESVNTAIPDRTQLKLHEIDLVSLAASAREMALALIHVASETTRAAPEVLDHLSSFVDNIHGAVDLLSTIGAQLNQLDGLIIRPQPEGLKTREAKPIPRDRILIVTKPSKIECDAKLLGVTIEEALDIQKQRGEDWQRIYNSHLQQMETRAEVLSKLSPEQVVFGRDLEHVDFSKYDVVVCLGGDNHFQYIAQNIKADIPFIGVSSDPIYSVGAILPFKASDFNSFVEDLEKGNYRFEPWTRLSVRVGETTLPPALCDLFIGELNRLEMSRNITSIVEYEDTEQHMIQEPVEQKSSGALIATGAGSTSWYKNASRQFLLRPRPFSPSEILARMVLTEFSLAIKDKGGKIVPLENITARATAVLKEGETLILRSLNDSQGIISADSMARLEFPRGSIAEISLADKPLWVIKKA